MSFLKKLLKIIFINIAVFIFLISFVVFGLPISYDIYKAVKTKTNWGYSSAPNFKNHEWAKKYFKENSELRTQYYDYIGWRETPYKGETINIDTNGYRRHSDTDFADASVWFFGGSTAWGTGSRDNETIPAYIQRLSNNSTFNFGSTGYVSHQSLNLLQKVYVEGGRPKYVVFYDGVNEVMHKCAAKNTFYSTALEKKYRNFIESGYSFDRDDSLVLAVFKPAIKAYQNFYEKFKFNDAFQFGKSSPNAKLNLGFNCHSNPYKLGMVAKALVSDWIAARKLVESNGGVFIPILQPVVYVGSPNISNQPGVGRVNASKGEAIHRANYELVYAKVRKLLDDINFKYYDFTRIFDDDGNLYYFDFCHVSPNGNEKVAREIDQVIK